MLSSAVMLAVNPAQWFGNSSLEDGLQVPTVEGPNHCAGFIAIVTPELNIIPATTAKKIIPFFLVFTVKILNCHVISDCHRYENIIKVLNRQ